MSVLFTNEEKIPRVDALIVAEGAEPPCGEYITAPPIGFDRVDRFSVTGAVAEFFSHALSEASRRGYTAVAVRFPTLTSRILYTYLLKVNLMRIVDPFDVDVYILVGEREKLIIREILGIADVVYPTMYSRRNPSAPFFCRMASAKPIRPDMLGDECCSAMPDASFEMGEPTPSLVDFIRDMDDTFAVRLLKLIDLKGMDEIKAYKAANVSRQTWYKIMNEKGYRPSKNTVISFAIALRLDLPETQALLATAGFTLSGSILFDKIISYCISEQIFDVFKINQILYSYDQECLGA